LPENLEWFAHPILRGRHQKYSNAWPRSRRLVADDADLVAVEIAHICAIIIGMIVLAQTRRAFVLAAGFDGRGVRRIDRRAVLGLETDCDAVADASRLLVERAHDPQLRPAAGAAVTHRLGIVGVAHQ